MTSDTTSKYQQAIDSGFSEDEIIDYYSKKYGKDKIDAALSHDYTPKQIADYYSENGEQQTPEPTSAERKLAQGSETILAAARSAPRLALETPGFLADVADIGAERLQQPLQNVPGQTEGPSMLQKLLPDMFPQAERKPEEEIFKPGTALRGLIPESVQEKYQQIKEAKVGDVPLFPTFDEASKELKGQLEEPDSFLRKTLPEFFGEKPLEFNKDAAQIEELLTPRDAWEEYQRSAIQMGVPIALLGAGSSGPSVTGFGLGIGDKYLEERGVSEDDRKLAAVLFAPWLSKGVEAIGEKVSGIGRGGPPGEGGGGSAPGADFISDIADAKKSPTISNTKELAVKMLSPRMSKINIEQLKRAKAEGINPTLASITEAGMHQFGANALSQNFITKSMFDKAAERMTGDIKNAIERKIETISPTEFLDLSEVTSEEIGSAPFTNPVKTLTESFSDDNLSNYETGENVQTRIKEIAEAQKGEAKKLYDSVKKDPNIEEKFTPIQSQLETRGMLKKKRTKGLPSEEKKALNTQLDRLEKFFTEEKKVEGKEGPVAELILPESLKREIAAAKGKKIAKPRKLTFLEAIEQVEDLNAIIDFDESIGNQSKALIPIRRALIRDIETGMKASGRGDLFKRWDKAKEQYADYAKNFGRDNPPVFRAQFTDKMESIVSSAKTRSGLQAFLKAFSKSGESERGYFNLQKKVIQEIAGQDALMAEELGKFKMSKERLKKLEELKPILQMDAQVILEDVKSLTERVGKGVKNEMRRDAVRADVLNSLAKGGLPVETLKVMNTPSGIKLVRDALSSTKNGKAFRDALFREKAREFMFDKAVDGDGSVNISKMNTNIKKNKSKIKQLMDKKAFGELEEIGKFADKAIKGDTAFRNFSQTETMRQNLGLIKKVYSMASTFAAGGATAAIFGGAESAVLMASIYALSKLYTNPKFIHALSETALKAAKNVKNKQSAKAYGKSVDKLVGVMKKELSPEDFKAVSKFNQ